MIIKGIISDLPIKELLKMYLIYKDNEYFGVCYDDLATAIYVCSIFSKTLHCEFNIRYAAKCALA